MSAIICAVEDFTGLKKQEDDISVMVLEFRGPDGGLDERTPESASAPSSVD